MSQRRISDPQLTKLWRMNSNTLSTWHAQGRLLSDGKYGDGLRDTHWYYHHTINSLHREGLPDKKTVLPDVAALLRRQAGTGTPSLLTTGEVAKRLEVKLNTVFQEIYKGTLVAFRLPGGGSWRITVYDLAAYRATLVTDAVRKDRAAQILGITEQYVTALFAAKPPLLERVHVLPKARYPFVSRNSLLAFVGEHLARDADGKPFLTAEEWWTMRELYDFEEMLTQDEIQARYRTNARTTRRLIDDGTFPCLLTPGGQARIPLHAVEQWHALRAPISPSLLEQTLGVSSAEAVDLVITRSFCNREHTKHHPGCPTPVCIETYIAAHRLGARFSAQSWVTSCTQDSMRLVVRPITGSAATDLETTELAVALEEKRVRGVLLPNGTHVAIPEPDWWMLKRAVRQMENKLWPAHE